VTGRTLRIVGLGLIVPVLVVAPISVYALVAPYSSVAVPSACEAAAGTSTASAQMTVEGLGNGIRVVRDGPIEVVAVLGPGGTVTGGNGAVLRDGRVIARLPIESRTVDAAVADGIVLLFDDKIGFLLDAQTGAPLPRLFESDNYRGQFTDGGVEHVQTSIEVTAVGLGGRPFYTMATSMGVVVDACLLTGE